MPDIGQTRPTPSTPNNAYQISGQTEFKSLKQLTFKAKMLCNPWLAQAATTESERHAGKAEHEGFSLLWEEWYELNLIFFVQFFFFFCAGCLLKLTPS